MRGNIFLPQEKTKFSSHPLGIQAGRYRCMSITKTHTVEGVLCYQDQLLCIYSGMTKIFFFCPSQKSTFAYVGKTWCGGCFWWIRVLHVTREMLRETLNRGAAHRAKCGLLIHSPRSSLFFTKISIVAVLISLLFSLAIFQLPICLSRCAAEFMAGKEAWLFLCVRLLYVSSISCLTPHYPLEKED